MIQSRKQKKKRPSRKKLLEKHSKTKTKAPTKKPKRKEPVVKEISGGGVVFKKYRDRVYLAMMKDSYEKWTFPKGRVEKGESIEEAAARETLEELGLQEIRFLDELGKIDIWFRDTFEKDGKLVHKDIFFFLFQTKPDAKLFADPEQRSFEVKWIPISRVLEKSDYADLTQVIKKALAYIKQTK